MTFLALFAVIVTSYGQNYEDLIKKADSCYEAKNYKLSTSFFEKAPAPARILSRGDIITNNPIARKFFPCPQRA